MEPRRDVIALMESILNKDISEFKTHNLAIMFLAQFEEGQRIIDGYRSMGDTHNDMFWTDFKRLIKQSGFVTFLLNPFTPRHGFPEMLIFAYHYAKGLFVTAQSYQAGRGPIINSGTLHGEIEAPVTMPWHDAQTVLITYNGGCLTDQRVTPMQFHVAYDIREGMLCNLERLELGDMTFCLQWTVQKHPARLWLVDFHQTDLGHGRSDEHSPGGYYDRCRDERLRRLPATVLRNIGYSHLING